MALAGGGALGSWQAGCLDVLAGAGLSFDKITGFSAGALSGVAYFLDRMPELVQRWREVETGRILRFSPRMRPFSIFSDVGVRESVDSARDEDHARKTARCEFTVISLNIDEDRTQYSRFTPNGGGAWDGPLADRLVASCAIPKIFPPVKIGPHTFIDGGIPGKEWIHFDALAECEDVIVIEMVRPEEVGRVFWDPIKSYEQQGRNLVRSQIDSGLQSLRRLARPPRIFRLYPSRRLDFSMLNFSSKYCIPALEQGQEDASQFLQDPVRD